MKYIDADRLRKAVEEKYNSNGGVDDTVEDKCLEIGYGVLPGIDPIINLPDSFKPRRKGNRSSPKKGGIDMTKVRIIPKILDVVEDDGMWLDKSTMTYYSKEDVEEVYLFPVLEEAAEEYATTHLRNNEFPTADSAFKAGAKWMQDQFEKNRLANCDKLTKEQYDRETDFAMEIIEKEHRQPTFTDSINYGMRVMKEYLMNEAVEGVVENWNPESHPEITIPLNPEEFTVGDKVKLIVIKEDEK